MLWIKKKKTLTISTNLKKIDTSAITSGKKSYLVEKKTFRPNKTFNRN